VISALGIAIEFVALIGMILLLSGASASMIVFYPIVLLELAVGLWLLIKGTTDAVETKTHQA